MNGAVSATTPVSRDLVFPCSNFLKSVDNPTFLGQRSDLFCGYDNLPRKKTMSTTRNNENAHSDGEAHNKVEEEIAAFTSSFWLLTFERRLALHRYTARNHRQRAKSSYHSTCRVTATG